MTWRPATRSVLALKWLRPAANGSSRMVEEDQEVTRSFELEAFALVFAEGQRRRLGLADFARV